jgi:PAP2 superfamily protein
VATTAPQVRIAAWVAPSLLLAAVFLANLVETWADARFGTPLSPRALTHATVMRGIEGGFTFRNHDMANPIAVYGYSAAYFVLFPLLVLAVGVVLARRAEREPYRVLALALTVDYAISLACFLLFPVPERWAFPESGAMLLSDLWTSRLIKAFRPMSALDNCFPSFHVSMMVIVIVTSYLYRVKLRDAVAALGAVVILSTFVLGIHWMPDIAAGSAVAVISVAVARRAVAKFA